MDQVMKTTYVYFDFRSVLLRLGRGSLHHGISRVLPRETPFFESFLELRIRQPFFNEDLVNCVSIRVFRILGLREAGN